MNCSQTRSHFDDYLDRTLSSETGSDVSRHLAVCPACRQALDVERVFRQFLRRQPVPPPSPGFAARALRQSTWRKHHPQRRSFVVGFASALAAVLVVWLAAGFFIQVREKSDLLPDVTLTLHQTRQVNLVFNTPQAFPDATLTIQLPTHIELGGYPGRRELSWQTTLREGQNLLTLPVVARDVRDGDLIAKIAYGSEEKTFRLRLKVVSPQAIQPNPVTHDSV